MPAPAAPAAPAPDAGVTAPVLTVRQRLRLAALERIPEWVRPRCGLEPRALAALCVVLVAAVGIAGYQYRTGRPQAVPVAERVPGPAPAAPSAPAPAAPSASVPAAPAPSAPGGGSPVVVDVAGKVTAPGIYTLPPGSRVADALDAAGGSRPGTDTDVLNRARVLTDGEHVLVGVTPPAAPPGPGPGGAAGGPAAAGPVSLSTATPEQLRTLPGIGPVLAANIVGHRERHGGFGSVDELLEVSGIGPRRLADLRDRVTR